eukprot:ctg_714.g303
MSRVDDTSGGQSVQRATEPASGWSARYCFDPSVFDDVPEAEGDETVPVDGGPDSDAVDDDSCFDAVRWVASVRTQAPLTSLQRDLERLVGHTRDEIAHVMERDFTALMRLSEEAAALEDERSDAPYSTAVQRCREKARLARSWLQQVQRELQQDAEQLQALIARRTHTTQVRQCVEQLAHVGVLLEQLERRLSDAGVSGTPWQSVLRFCTAGAVARVCADASVAVRGTSGDGGVPGRNEHRSARGVNVHDRTRDDATAATSTAKLSRPAGNVPRPRLRRGGDPQCTGRASDLGCATPGAVGAGGRARRADHRMRDAVPQNRGAAAGSRSGAAVGRRTVTVTRRNRRDDIPECTCTATGGSVCGAVARRAGLVTGADGATGAASIGRRAGTNGFTRRGRVAAGGGRSERASDGGVFLRHPGRIPPVLRRGRARVSPAAAGTAVGRGTTTAAAASAVGGVFPTVESAAVRAAAISRGGQRFGGGVPGGSAQCALRRSARGGTHAALSAGRRRRRRRRRRCGRRARTMATAHPIASTAIARAMAHAAPPLVQLAMSSALCVVAGERSGRWRFVLVIGVRPDPPRRATAANGGAGRGGAAVAGVPGVAAARGAIGRADSTGADAGATLAANRRGIAGRGVRASVAVRGAGAAGIRMHRAVAAATRNPGHLSHGEQQAAAHTAESLHPHRMATAGRVSGGVGGDRQRGRRGRIGRGGTTKTGLGRPGDRAGGARVLADGPGGVGERAPRPGRIAATAGTRRRAAAAAAAAARTTGRCACGHLRREQDRAPDGLGHRVVGPTCPL